VEAGGNPSLNEVVGAVPVGGGAGHAGHFAGSAGHAGPMGGGGGHAGHFTGSAGYDGHLTGSAGHIGPMGGGGGHAGHFSIGAGPDPAFHMHSGVANAGLASVNIGSAGLSTRGSHNQQHQQNYANQLEAIRENMKVKNETIGDLRKELLEKMLMDNMATLTYQVELMQVEKDFKRAELSCKGALFN